MEEMRRKRRKRGGREEEERRRKDGCSREKGRKDENTKRTRED